MEELNLSIEKLINESPVDEATKHHDKTHISELVKEEILEVTTSNVLHTDKHYRTHRIEEAAIISIKDRLGRWASQRNDIVLQAKGALAQQSSSELDIKKRKLTEKMENAKSKAKDLFMRNNNYLDLRSNFEATKNRYEGMRSELGGKPPIQRRVWLYVIAILIIGFIEWFVNYSTFSTKYPQGIAFGATVLVALSIALASHFHGGLLKQRLALFARHVKKEEKRQVIIKQSFFSLLLIIALIIVTYNRYDILATNMIESGGISLAGINNETDSVMGVLVQFILLNLLVWIVGVAISYFIHDPRPDYQEAFKHYEAAKLKFYKLDNKLQEEIDRIGEEFENQLKNISNSLSSHQNDIKTLKLVLDRLAAKEASIIKQAVNSINNMLEKHHSMLITEFNTIGLNKVKIGPDALSIEQYKSKIITVDINFVRHTLSMEAV